MSTNAEQFTLTLRAIPGKRAPVIIRLRHVLKALLRAYGFRCVSCRPMPKKDCICEACEDLRKEKKL
jgi:hypothetical protein